MVSGFCDIPKVPGLSQASGTLHKDPAFLGPSQASGSLRLRKKMKSHSVGILGFWDSPKVPGFWDSPKVPGFWDSHKVPGLSQI